MGLWRYNPRHWIVTCGTRRPIEILGVPLLVRVGYFAIMGTIVPALVWIWER